MGEKKIYSMPCPWWADSFAGWPCELYVGKSSVILSRLSAPLFSIDTSAHNALGAAKELYQRRHSRRLSTELLLLLKGAELFLALFTTAESM